MVHISKEIFNRGAHQEGYHWLFKPFVKGMHKNKIIKMIGAHVAKHRTQHLKHIMFNSKSSLLGKIYNKILGTNMLLGR